MSKQISTTAALSSMPIPLGPAPIRSLSRLRSAIRSIKAAAGTDPRRLDRFPITPRETATDAERALFSHRRDELKRWLAPAGNRVTEPVLALLVAMPSQGGSDADRAMRVTTYVEDLGDLPLFAIVRACKDFRLGIIGSKHWAPTAAEIREHAAKIAEPFHVELADIAEVLEFDPPSADLPPDDPEAMKARVRKVADDTLQRISGVEKEDQEARREAAEKWLENYRSDPHSSTVISDALRAVIAKPRGEL